MQDLRGTLEEGFIKIFNGSLVILKGTHRNNLYYLKGSTITENLTISESLKGDSTGLWKMRLENFGMNSLQDLTK